MIRLRSNKQKSVLLKVFILGTAFSSVVLFFQNCTKSNINFIETESGSLSSKVSDAASSRKYFYVDTYGAQPNGTGDSTAAVKAAIDSAVNSGGPAEVIFSSGKYRLACPTPVFDDCFYIKGAKGLTIRGAGYSTQLLIANPSSGGFYIDQGQDIILRDFSIDYETLPFTQGRITAIKDGNFNLRIDSGFPSPNDPLFVKTYASMKSVAGMVYNSWEPTLAKDSSNWIAITPVNADKMAQTKDGINFSFKTTNSSLTPFMSVGNRFVFSGRNNGTGIFAASLTNISIINVAIHASSGAAIVAVGVSGLLLADGVTVGVPSNSNRLMSTCADAFHLQGNSAKILIQNSNISGMGDDAINIYSVGTPVKSLFQDSAGNKIISIDSNWNANMFKTGHQVQVFDSTLKISKGRGTVLSQPSTNSVQISGISGSLTAGDILFDVTAAGSAPWIIRNYFGPFRGLFRIRSADTVFAFNTIADSRNAKILQSQDALWYASVGTAEGPGVPEIQNIYSNTVPGGVVQWSQDYMTSWQSTLIQYSNSSHLNNEKLQPPYFDPKIYVQLNPDLGSMNYDQLAQHWLDHGQAEGRLATVYFSARDYLALYPDLVAAYGANGFKSAQEHYYSAGIFENRQSSIFSNPLVFSPTHYRDLNPDLAGFDNSGLYIHWLKHGISEGRRGTIGFNSRYYLNTYSDLKSAFGGQNYRSAISHYITNGLNEGRRSSVEFDVNYYKATYSDLRSGTNRDTAIHWQDHGIYEGRNGSASFSPSNYLNRYSDLRIAYGTTNYYQGLLHWITHGIYEGRSGI